MTTFTSAVSALETATGMDSAVTQVAYITMVAERKAKALVADHVAEYNKAKNGLTFAINNEDTDLAWAMMGTVAEWTVTVDQAESALVAARVKANAIAEHVATVRERTAA